MKVRSLYLSLQFSSKTCLLHVVKKAVLCGLPLLNFACGQSVCRSLRSFCMWLWEWWKLAMSMTFTGINCHSRIHWSWFIVIWACSWSSLLHKLKQERHRVYRSILTIALMPLCKCLRPSPYLLSSCIWDIALAWAVTSILQLVIGF